MHAGKRAYEPPLSTSTAFGMAYVGRLRRKREDPHHESEDMNEMRPRVKPGTLKRVAMVEQVVCGALDKAGPSLEPSHLVLRSGARMDMVNGQSWHNCRTPTHTHTQQSSMSGTFPSQRSTTSRRRKRVRVSATNFISASFLGLSEEGEEGEEGRASVSEPVKASVSEPWRRRNRPGQAPRIRAKMAHTYRSSSPFRGSLWLGEEGGRGGKRSG